MAHNVLVDSGFWFALWDQGDQWHRSALAIAPDLMPHRLVIPWPTLYEVLCTRFVRQRHRAEGFVNRLDQINHHKMDDRNYRYAALSEVKRALVQGRNLSLVDAVLRQMLRDETLRLKGIVTFNHRDFDDLVYTLGIELYPSLMNGR